MKVVIDVERSQLRRVLQELGESFSDMEIVINIKEAESKEKIKEAESKEKIKEAESKEKRPNYESFTTEDLQLIQEKEKEMEKKEEYST